MRNSKKKNFMNNTNVHISKMQALRLKEYEDKVTNLKAYENKPLNPSTLKSIRKYGTGVPVIYAFTRNGKMYVGRSVNLGRRIRQHMTDAPNRRRSKHCTIFYNSIRDHDWKEFTFKVLRHCPECLNLSNFKSLMKQWEADFIKELKPALNVIDASGRWADTEIVRELKAGRPSLKGVPRAAETRAKISRSLTGLKASTSTRFKMALAQGQKVKVYCYSTDTETEYISMKEAALAVGCDAKTIKKYLDGEPFTTKSKKQYKVSRLD